MTRAVCIHGHFYQPPRENPWTDEIDPEPTAKPHQNWNERITEECYRPNALAGNFERLSFNFGPTLIRWIQRKAPDVYDAILKSDRGNAMAQCYNHMIMPLANTRDRMTQVIWGIRDFEFRFKRKPQGIWLPETAVDRETLEILADQGIAFTILAPHQAAAVRPIGSKQWQPVDEHSLNTNVAYRAPLPGGRSVDLFFYNGPVSRGVAFEKLLSSGEGFAQRLKEFFGDQGGLVHIAADGETYGHHHKEGEKGLAEGLKLLEKEGIEVTHYAAYLGKHPPTQEVQIKEKSSWSCVHGIDRWWSDCGCNTEPHAGWNQAWRTPLRDALDWLRETINLKFESMAKGYYRDPWEARNEFIHLILEPTDAAAERFLQAQASAPLDEPRRRAALKLMQMQKQLMLMYTSCGWFFNDVSGVETVLILRHAARALQLGEELLKEPLEPHFLELLARAKSNLSEFKDGRQVYERLVSPVIG